MDNSKVYIYGKEVVTPYYLNEAVADKATKAYVNSAVGSLIFEGTQVEYDALTDEQKASYSIVIIDDVELTQEDEIVLNNTIGEETETVIDLTTKEANSKLDDIIGGE